MLNVPDVSAAPFNLQVSRAAIRVPAGANPWPAMPDRRLQGSSCFEMASFDAVHCGLQPSVNADGSPDIVFGCAVPSARPKITACPTGDRTRFP